MSVAAVKGRQDKALIGIALMLVAFLTFSFIDTGAKWLGAAGLSAMQLSFMRYLPHFMISTVLVNKDGMDFNKFRSQYFWLLLLRGLMLMGSTVFNFFAVGYLPLTLTSTILFSSPIIICFLSWPLLGERVGIYRWSAIMIGFAGVMIAIRPFDDSFHWAVLFSLSGAFCFALYSILTRKLSGLVSIDIMQFYTGAVGTFMLLPFAVYQWQSPATPFAWGVMIMLGLFGWGGHQILTEAYRFAPASTLTPFGYSFIIYLTVWSYLVFDHLPDIWTIIGALFIVVSGLIIWLREIQRARTLSQG